MNNVIVVIGASSIDQAIARRVSSVKRVIERKALLAKGFISAGTGKRAVCRVE